MPNVIKKFFSVLVCSGMLLFPSCDDKSTSVANVGTDSLSLCVAVLPIDECNVLKQAVEDGVADSLGLKLRLVDYDALMDLDTALLSGCVHVGFQDAERISRIKEDSLKPGLVLPVPVRITLVANGKREVGCVEDLRTRIVGLTRWSQLENLMNNLADSAGLDEMSLYYAQINSIPIRCSMVKDGLIDAALIPRPWSGRLLDEGHCMLRDTVLEGMGFYMSPVLDGDSSRLEQVELFRQFYLKALKAYGN